MVIRPARHLLRGVILISGLLGLSVLDGHPATTQARFPDSRVQPGGSTVTSAAWATAPPFWLPIPPMRTRRAYLAAILGADRRIYALGGGNVLPNALATGEAFDTTTNTWTPIAPMTTPRLGFGLATGPGGRIYALGGSDGKHDLGSVEAYLPASKRWVEVAATGAPRLGLVAIAGPASAIYTLEENTGIEAYEPTTKTWTHVANLLTRRGGFAAALGPDKRLYTLGGQSDDGIYSLRVAEAYDPQTRRWLPLPDLPTERSGLAAVSAPDGRLYAMGGWQGEFSATAAVEAYDPRTRRWSTVASLHAYRAGLQAVRGPDGRLYALGGATGSSAAVRGAPPEMSDYLAIVEAYGPLIHATLRSVTAGSSVVLTGTNFAASATVSVTWGTTPGGRVLATGYTNQAGALLHPLRFHVPAGVQPGRYTVTALDDRSRYPVTASLAVGVPASFGLAPTPLPLPTATATPSATTTSTGPQTRYVSPQGRNAPDCTRPAAPCQTISYAVDQARDEDTISVAAGVYSETVTLPVGLRLVGAGATRTVLDGGGRGPVVTTASGTVVTLTGMTLRNGAYQGGFYGGGIANHGANLTVTASVLSGNHSANGGGIFNSDGTLTVIDSTINANSAVSYGGGVTNLLGRVTVRGSTISGNTVHGDGGGIATTTGAVRVSGSTLSGNSAGGNGGGIVNVTGSALTVRESTISGNKAGADGGGIANPTGGQVGVSGSTISANTAGRRGGGFATANPTVPQVVTGTILAGNHAHDGGPDCAGTLTSGGGNLLGSGTGCTWLRRGHTADLLGTAAAPRDPLLGPLQDNGGPTHTQALLPGSPALDAIPAHTAACPAGAQDQRGLTRPYPAGGACDSGALEMRYP